MVSTATNFLLQLDRSGLFSAAQMDELRRYMPRDLEPERVVQVLQQRGLLTPWQANELVAGRGRNFVLGKYTLVDRIGVGSRAEVFKGIQRGIGREVAIKVLSPELGKCPRIVQRFRREARALATLNHPNVVTCYDADCEGDLCYLVTECLAGRDLNSWLSQHHPLPLGWSCECIRQVALALQHAHEHGLVHRDIKPGNILVLSKHLEERPQVKLLDLGFARLIPLTEDEEARLTLEGEVFGTPDYIAPEQAEDSHSADIRADIYSLGVTLFKLLTGHVPYEGRTPMQKMITKAIHDAPRAASMRDDLPPELDSIVAKMLSREAEDRYQTPQEVADALAPFCMTAPVKRVQQVQPQTAVPVAQPAPVPQVDMPTLCNNMDTELTPVAIPRALITAPSPPPVAQPAEAPQPVPCDHVPISENHFWALILLVAGTALVAGMGLGLLLAKFTF